LRPPAPPWPRRRRRRFSRLRGALRRENAPRYRFDKFLFAAFEATVRRIPDAQIVVNVNLARARADGASQALLA
jgi:hypothetical protein